MYSFEVKHNLKTSKSLKVSAVQNGYLRFLIFFPILTPKTKNIDITKIKAYKFQIFGVIQKMECML